MRRPQYHIATIIGVMLTSSCRSSTAVEDPVAASCSGNIMIAVTPGTTPVISWSPRCGISYLVVETVPGPGAAPAAMWSFYVPEQQPIGPSIVYGQAPLRATSNSPQPLHAGTKYRVRAGQTVGLDASVADGVTEFTP